MQRQRIPEQEERHFNVPNEYERTQEEALETTDQTEEKNEQGKNKKGDRCKQMVELKLREDEVCGLCRSCFWGNRQYYKFINIPLLVTSAEGGAEGSVSQAEAAGEAREGKETAGRETKEFRNAVREWNTITSHVGCYCKLLLWLNLFHQTFSGSSLSYSDEAKSWASAGGTG